MACEHPQGWDENLNTQTESSLNNVPHYEVVYGIGHTRRVLDPLVRRNRN
jgi:predicted oxidoreductase